MSNLHYTDISTPWEHERPVSVIAFLPDDRHPMRAGRAALTFRASGFELSLSPTANDLRRLAQIVTALADQMQKPACAVTAAEAA